MQSITDIVESKTETSLDWLANDNTGFTKGLASLCYLALVVLTWRFFDKEPYLHLGIAAAVLSFFWLLLTSLQLRKLLTSYFDIFSRLEVTIPVTLGVTLSFLSFHATEILLLRVIACLELAFWLHIYIQYRENRARFVVQGHGPVPKGCWISPPASVLVAGDLILTSGRVATNLRESVGHAEMVIVMPDGKKKALSSYMVNGLVLNPLEEVASKTLEQGHYIVLRLRKSLTRQQSLEAANIALEMMEANERWKNKRNEQRHKMIFSLPLSQGLKIKLYHMVKATGYDWLGLLLGRLTKDHWTCIAACLEVYRRLGIKTNSYGTGLFGFGSSIFDPIMPVRFLSDPAFRLLEESDRQNEQVLVNGQTQVNVQN